MLEMMKREATLSECRRYRYTLLRRWGPKPSGVTWVMCNPSTADAEIDDPTIRRVMAFTQRLGYDAALVVNLFAYRATDPDELFDVEDPCGQENGKYVGWACRQSELIVVAWGAIPKGLRALAKAFVELVRDEKGLNLKCLGTTKDGQPRHPLYLRSDAPLIDWKCE